MATIETITNIVSLPDVKPWLEIVRVIGPQPQTFQENIPTAGQIWPRGQKATG